MACLLDSRCTPQTTTEHEADLHRFQELIAEQPESQVPSSSAARTTWANTIAAKIGGSFSGISARTQNLELQVARVHREAAL